MLLQELDIGNRQRCIFCNEIKIEKIAANTLSSEITVYRCKKYKTEDFLQAVQRCRLGAEK